MTNTDGAQAQAQPAAGQANVGLIAQYVKDLSFENPGAPNSLRTRGGNPQINVSLNVNMTPSSPEEFETELRIEASGADGGSVLFALELVYAGLFRHQNVPADNLRPMALIECARLLFPFARQVVAEVTRNGGFPPLLIDPVDFVGLYRQSLAQASTTMQPPPANA